MLNEIADGEFEDLENEVVDLLERVGLDDEFHMIDYDSDAASDLLTVTAKHQPKNRPAGSAQHIKPQTNAAEKYEKMMKQRKRREKELKSK